MPDSPSRRAQLVLDEQIEVFLSKGGEITEVRSGKSGLHANRKKSQLAQDKKSGI